MLAYVTAELLAFRCLLSMLIQQIPIQSVESETLSMLPASSQSDLVSLSSYHQVSKKVLLKALVWEFQNLSSEFQSDIIARYINSRSESISFLVDKGKHVQQRKRKRTHDEREHRSRRTTG